MRVASCWNDGNWQSPAHQLSSRESTYHIIQTLCVWCELLVKTSASPFYFLDGEGKTCKKGPDPNVRCPIIWERIMSCVCLPISKRAVSFPVPRIYIRCCCNYTRHLSKWTGSWRSWFFFPFCFLSDDCLLACRRPMDFVSFAKAWSRPL